MWISYGSAIWLPEASNPKHDFNADARAFSAVAGAVSGLEVREIVAAAEAERDHVICDWRIGRVGEPPVADVADSRGGGTAPIENSATIDAVLAELGRDLLETIAEAVKMLSDSQAG